MAKRKSPRKKAVNATQIDEQLARYQRLLDKQLAALTTTAKRMELYNKKVKYYQSRKAEHAAAAQRLIQALQEAALQEVRRDQRPARAITLRSG